MKVGCLSTFREAAQSSGMLSAGTCTLDGHLVALRVQPDASAHYPWPKSIGARDVPAEGGPGWIFRASDVSTLNKVAARLDH
jgi:hypothetical protein